MHLIKYLDKDLTLPVLFHLIIMTALWSMC